MSFIRLAPTGPIWPYTDAQLRADEPATLFPPILTAADRKPFGVIEPQPIDAPSYDPATEHIEEVHPILVGDTWTQQWAVVALNPDELPTIVPAPDWTGFKRAMLESPELNAALTAAFPAAPIAVLALPTALSSAVSGDPSDFRACWIELRRGGWVNAALLSQVDSAATACNLPDPVRDAISGVMP